ncbi:MAG: carbohydrate-binding module family 20 domain-containing protein [Ferruginibacter sp.]
MTIHFYLRFTTQFGQAIYVSGNTNLLGNDDLDKPFAMNTSTTSCGMAALLSTL